ncbi:MAG: HlyD family efflux transporter periplasmic adaptor subunit [Cyanobacteriota bacterium]|nr:HlyD family efflux transporter periplasmic adaptor subunit [Cyanobacteriota bacterium]
MYPDSAESPRTLVPPLEPPSAERAAVDDKLADLLPRLDLEDYIPSVRPWLRISSLAVISSVALGVGFMAVCPYRVVVRGPGWVRPAGEQVLVNAPFEGRVVSIDVTTNQPVVAGQPIVTLDRAQLRGEVQLAGRSREALRQQMQALRQEATADYARAQLEVEKSRSTLEFARSEVRRYETLVRQGAATVSLFEAKRAAVAEAMATYNQAIENLSAVRSQARSREAELRREGAGIDRSSQEGARNLVNATVRSPMKGIVFQLRVQNPQQTIAAGQALAVITPSSAEKLVKVEVRSEDVQDIIPGQRADLRLASCPYPDFGTLPARVISVSPDALPQRGVVQGTEGVAPTANLYEVTLKPLRLALSGAARTCEVKVGMQLKADILTREETILRFVLRKTRLLVGR